MVSSVEDPVVLRSAELVSKSGHELLCGDSDDRRYTLCDKEDKEAVSEGDKKSNAGEPTRLLLESSGRGAVIGSE
jgi:hypothetical protein